MLQRKIIYLPDFAAHEEGIASGISGDPYHSALFLFSHLDSLLKALFGKLAFPHGISRIMEMFILDHQKRCAVVFYRGMIGLKRIDDDPVGVCPGGPVIELCNSRERNLDFWSSKDGRGYVFNTFQAVRNRIG